ncbi:ParB/RepB/Spo0J family partition protein [Paraburkholderia aspalathi]|nr:ParB/RepB/Spo0J family partition protein [Paraburkholderia aspalathi]MBK3780039.1 ParB/RepB/Spo0J family partition protein [Paraburkholderia aspalathi]
MSRKLDLDRGFSKAHAGTKTAFDRFAAAEKVLGAEDDANARGNKPHAVALSPAAESADNSPASGTVVEADFKDSFSPEYRAWCARNDYKPGSVTSLSLSSVKQSPFNPRHFYRKNSISTLAINLSSQGQQDPIHVSPDYEKDGEFFLNDGGRRVRSLREIQAKDVKAIIDDVPQGIKSYKLGYDLNSQHETQTVFDDAIVWKRLLEDKHFESQVALAEELSIDKSMVTMTLSIGELPTALIEEMVDSPQIFGANMAYAVVKYFRTKGEKSTLALIRRILAEGLSVRKVNDLVRKATDETEGEGRQRARYAERVEIKFFGDVHVGDLRTYGEDRLALDLRGLTRDVRDRVQERIQAVLAEEGRGKDTLV